MAPKWTARLPQPTSEQRGQLSSPEAQYMASILDAHSVDERSALAAMSSLMTYSAFSEVQALYGQPNKSAA